MAQFFDPYGLMDDEEKKRRQREESTKTPSQEAKVEQKEKSEATYQFFNPNTLKDFESQGGYKTATEEIVSTPQAEPEKKSGVKDFISNAYQSVKKPLSDFFIGRQNVEMVSGDEYQRQEAEKKAQQDAESQALQDKVIEVNGKSYTREDVALGASKQLYDIQQRKLAIQDELVNQRYELMKIGHPLMTALGKVDALNKIGLKDKVANASEEEAKAHIRQVYEENNYGSYPTEADTFFRYGVKGKLDDKKRLNELESERAKELQALDRAEDIYRELSMANPNDKNFWSGVKQGFSEPEKLLPFAGSVFSFMELKALYNGTRKQQNGQDPTPYEESVMNKATAEQLDAMLNTPSMGYVVGNSLTQLPAFAVEFATTAGIGSTASTGIKGTSIVSKIASKSPTIAKLIGGLTGVTAQTTIGFMPRVLEKSAEFTVDDMSFAVTDDGKLTLENMGSDEEFVKALKNELPKGYAYTWVEVASEKSGEAMVYLKNGLVTKYIAKKGLDVTTEAGVKSTSNLLQKIGWNGILAEIGEEEIAELGQAPLEGRDYKAPVITEEGNQRLLTEALVIGIWGGLVNTTNKAFQSDTQKYVKDKAKELGISEQETAEILDTLQEKGMEEKTAEEQMAERTDSRPDHQKKLEELMNAEKWAEAQALVDSIPEDDPYKKPMQKVLEYSMPEEGQTVELTAEEKAKVVTGEKKVEETPIQEEVKPDQEKPEIAVEKPMQVAGTIGTEDEDGNYKFERDTDQADYDNYLKEKWESTEAGEGEIKIIKSGTGEWVDTNPVTAINRGVDANTKVLVVKETELNNPDNADKTERGERLLSNFEKYDKQFIDQQSQADARRLQIAEGLKGEAKETYFNADTPEHIRGGIVKASTLSDQQVGDMVRNIYRPYIERGDTYSDMRKGMMGSTMPDFVGSVSIGGYIGGQRVPTTKVIVNLADGRDYTFNLSDIFKDVIGNQQKPEAKEKKAEPTTKPKPKPQQESEAKKEEGKTEAKTETKTEASNDEASDRVKTIKDRDGDFFDLVEPVSGLWNSNKKVIYIRPKRSNTGFAKYMEAKPYVIKVQEAGGNNVYQITLKQDFFDEKTKKVIAQKVNKQADISKVEKAIYDKTGKKSIKDATVIQFEEGMESVDEQTEKINVYEVTTDISKKYGATNKAISKDSLDSKPDLLYGSEKGGYFTDGFIAILDKEVSQKEAEALIEKYKQKDIKSFTTLGITYEEASKSVDKSIKEKQEQASYPEIEPILEMIDALSNKQQEVEVDGIFANKISGSSYALTGDDKVIFADPDKIEYMAKLFPNAKMFMYEQAKPVIFKEGDEIKGLVMPLFLKGNEPDIYKDNIKTPSGYATTGLYQMSPKYKEQYNGTERPALPDGLAKGTYESLDVAKGELKDFKAFQFPELVKLARNLTGEVPDVRKLRSALGVARTKNGVFDAKIRLDPIIFKDEELMSKVLAHEIGHIADYYEEGSMKRGNLIGRITSQLEYMKKVFTSFNTEEKISDLRMKRKEYQFQRSLLKSSEDGKVIEEMREQDKKLRNEIININRQIKELHKQTTIKNEEVFEELKHITQIWNPFDETADENYTKYRYSSVELYAEAMSVLMNQPKLLKQEAPKFYKAWFEYLDKKPTIKGEFFELWDLYNLGEEALGKQREQEILEMFSNAEDKFTALTLEKLKQDKDLLFKFKYDFIDKNQAVIDKISQLKKKGIYIGDDANPQYALEDFNYANAKIKNFFADNYQPIYDELNENEIGMEKFGEVLFLERVAQERGASENPVTHLKKVMGEEEWNRSYADLFPENIEDMSAIKQLGIMEKVTKETLSVDGGTLWDDLQALLPKGIANPRGFTTSTAKEQLKYIENQMSPEKWNKMQNILEKFRKVNQEALQMATEEGLISESLYKELSANPAYATFQVIDYMDTYVSSSFIKQVGTLKDISNPAISTLQKTYSILRAIERNKAKRKVATFMHENFPDEIKQAQTKWNGKRQIPIDPKDPKLGLLTYKENGETKAYYVDKYIADTIQTADAGTTNAVIHVLFEVPNTKLFRPLFITFNTGFQAFNLIRDFFRYFKSVPKLLSLHRALYQYGKALKPAYRRAWGISDDLIKEMENEYILNISFSEMIAGEEQVDTQFEYAMKKAGMNIENKQRAMVLRPLMSILDTIQKVGTMIETIPKVAGYMELQGKMPRGQLAQFIRTAVGSPDFMRKGNSYRVYNNVFLFSNAIKEGMRADLYVATNPTTRSGYWFKTAMLNFLPKFLMYAGLMGLFGDEMKKMFNKVSEYDMTNYVVIPLSLDENGKTVYLRVPQDETGRLLSALVWKTMRANSNNRPLMQDVTDIFSFMGGQLPSMSPVVDVTRATGQFLGGQNPYDYFRGRNVLTDQEYEAGGMYAMKPFAIWALNQLGAGVFFKSYNTMQSPESKTWVQKVVEAPVLSNVVGRFVKVSDYGEYEKNKAIIKEQRSLDAKRTLEKNEVINKKIQEFQKSDLKPQTQLKYEKEMVEEIYGQAPYDTDTKREISYTVKKYRVGIVRGSADSNVNSLISAQSNNEKVTLLKKLKGDMNKDDFINLEKMLVKEKIVSKEVLNEVNQ